MCRQIPEIKGSFASSGPNAVILPALSCASSQKLSARTVQHSRPDNRVICPIKNIELQPFKK